ncbi:MAG: M48 family metallopeptidase [Clostridia bacterium]|nr:M48 family metallopeptidase [Clostridia bacterium]
MIEYELRRSKRRTLSVEVDREAKLIVRAPLHMPQKAIDDFLQSHIEWIEKHISQRKEKIAAAPKEPTEDETLALRQKAYDVLSQKTAHYAAQMGVTYTHIGITSAKGRYGSCSKQGRINYSWRLMLQDEATWDYIVVHELCHLTHFDHSKAFWQMVEKYLPDYKERKALLK